MTGRLLKINKHVLQKSLVIRRVCCLSSGNPQAVQTDCESQGTLTPRRLEWSTTIPWVVRSDSATNWCAKCIKVYYTHLISPTWTAIAQSLQRLATGWTVRGSNPGGGGRDFPQTGPGAHPASCTMGTGSFPRVKRPRRGADHLPHPAQKLKKEYSYTSTFSLSLRGLL